MTKYNYIICGGDWIETSESMTYTSETLTEEEALRHLEKKGDEYAKGVIVYEKTDDNDPEPIAYIGRGQTTFERI